MTNKEIFIANSAMRNLQSCFSQYRDIDCNTDDTVNNCYEAAYRLANLIFKE